MDIRSTRTGGPTALDQYCAELRRYPLLDAEEERRLARVTGPGRAACRHRLVTANLRFVVRLAGAYRSSGVPLIDLVQEGNVGLVKAVQRFDPDRNVRVISYAAPWIRAHIHEHLLRSHSLVRLGTTAAQRRLFFSLARARRALEGAGPRREADGGDAALARVLGATCAEVEEMSTRLAGRDLSIDPWDDAAEPGHAPLQLADDRPAQDEVLAEAEEAGLARGSVRAALAQLDVRERFVVEQRVMREEPLTLAAVGLQLRISSERARQLEVRATRKLRRVLEDAERAVA